MPADRVRPEIRHARFRPDREERVTNACRRLRGYSMARRAPAGRRSSRNVAVDRRTSPGGVHLGAPTSDGTVAALLSRAAFVPGLVQPPPPQRFARRRRKRPLFPRGSRRDGLVPQSDAADAGERPAGHLRHARRVRAPLLRHRFAGAIFHEVPQGEPAASSGGTAIHQLVRGGPVGHARRTHGTHGAELSFAGA